MENYLASLQGRILIAAHRGVAGGNVPCNSMLGYRAALHQGADVIELDVSRSLDGTLYCFHPCMEPRFARSEKLISQMHDEEVQKLRLVNMDGAATAEPVPLLEEALKLLQGKCRVNIDKFWDDVPGISALVRKLGMQDQVIVKTSLKPENLAKVREYAADLPFMPVLFSDDGAHEALLRDQAIRYIGAEVIFDSEESPFCQPAYIDKIHRDGCVLWVNPILYDYHAQLTAGHTDDRAVSGDEDGGWGWLIDKGYDILQTDWPLSLRLYGQKKYPGRF